MYGDRVNVFLFVAAKDGSFEPVKQTNRLISIAFEDNETKADKLTLKIDNRDLYHLDSPIWREGNLVRCGWGYAGLVSPERECTIDKVKGGRVLTVEASGNELIAHKRIVTATWENMTRSEVAREIAKKMGFTSDQIHVQTAEVKFDVIPQPASTDATFLQQLADKEGFVFFVDYDGFHFHERQLDQAPQLTLRYVVTGGEVAPYSDIKDFNFDKGIDATRPASLKAYGRDPLTKEDIFYQADNASVKRHSLGASLQLMSPDDASVEPLADRVGTEAAVHLLAHSEAELKRRADGIFKRIQIGAIKLKVKARGVPSLVAKSNVKIEGLGPTLSGTYYVKSAKHNPRPGPYMMDLELSRDGQTVKVAPTDDPLPGQGEGVDTAAAVNDREPNDPEELTLVKSEDGFEYADPGRELKLQTD